MEKETIGILNIEVEHIKGKKENKEYDFKNLKIKLDNMYFNLYPKESDRKLFNYLLNKELGE